MAASMSGVTTSLLDMRRGDAYADGAKAAAPRGGWTNAAANDDDDDDDDDDESAMVAIKWMIEDFMIIYIIEDFGEMRN
jgi:hypothetical protein